MIEGVSVQTGRGLAEKEKEERGEVGGKDGM